MYFLIPALLCQDEAFNVDGYIDDAIDLELIKAITSAHHNLLLAKEYAGFEIVIKQSHILSSTIDLSKIEVINSFSSIALPTIDASAYQVVSMAHRAITQTIDLPFILATNDIRARIAPVRSLSLVSGTTANKNQIQFTKALSSKIIAMHLLPGTPGYVGGLIGATRDLSGYLAVEVPVSVVGVIGFIDDTIQPKKFFSTTRHVHTITEGIETTRLANILTNQKHTIFNAFDSSKLDTVTGKVHQTQPALSVESMTVIIFVSKKSDRFIDLNNLGEISQVVEKSPSAAKDNFSVVGVDNQSIKLTSAVSKAGYSSPTLLLQRPQ